MKFKVIIQPIAKAQFRVIHAYLKAEFGIRAAQNFQESFARVLDVISENPRIYEVVPDRQNVRKCSALTPSLIYYSIDDHARRIDIVAIYDGRSDRKVF